MFDERQIAAIMRRADCDPDTPEGRRGFGRLLGVSDRSIRRWLSGERRPSGPALRLLERLGRVLARASAPEERQAACTKCGRRGVIVDTAAGEIVEAGEVIWSADGAHTLFRRGEHAFCRGCEGEEG